MYVQLTDGQLEAEHVVVLGGEASDIDVELGWRAASERTRISQHAYLCEGTWVVPGQRNAM